MNLYTSDLHFGHKDIIAFDHRPFYDINQMDFTLIKLWNSRVQKDDHVYILGDFCCGSDKPAEYYLRQLKGHKHLIIGNNDKELLDNDKAMSYFESVKDVLQLTDHENIIYLNHYPMALWDGSDEGTYHFYGHIHCLQDETYHFMNTRKKAINVGCMLNNYTPSSFNELLRNIKYRKDKLAP